MKRLASLFSGKDHARAAAFAIAAACMLVPANFLPVITLDSAGQTRTDTIFSSITGLMEDDLWVIGGIVFTASILVPFLKLAGLTLLLVAARRRPHPRARALTRLYAGLDFIGRWSMLDVFLIAFLTGVVQFGPLAAVQPRPGILAFAAAVVLTMLATQAFDPRVLWPPPASAAVP